MLLKDFISALKFVAPAMGVKDVRHYLNGVYLEFMEGGTITLTATDGHRFHTITMEHEHGQPKGALAVSSASVKTWLAAVKPVRGQDIELDISAPCDVPMLHGIPAQTIDGRYPDMRRVMPPDDTAPTESIVFNAEYLTAATKAIRCLGQPVCRIDLFGDGTRMRVVPSSGGFWSEAICVVALVRL